MRSFAVPLLLLAALGGAAPGPAPPRAEPVLGLNVQPASAGELLPRVREVGVRHVRASWWWWTTPADWSWYPAYRRAGIEVLPLVYAGPGDPGGAGGRMARRYRALFDAHGPFPYVQLDNEVDGDGPFGIPGGDPYRQGRRWGEQVRRAARLIRAFDPGVKLVSAGVAWNRDGVRDWLRGVVDAGGFDVLAIHPYGIGSAGEPLSRYRAVREAGWEGPVWATELGASDAQARYVRRSPDAFQAEQLRTILTADPSRLGYERLYWFQLTGDPEGYGILREDGTPRPAFAWLRSRAQ
ncbi:MAG TPA: glycosyl hydrolase [Longimicrobiaceae bacterium]|nr:glycosyl hydrolase [Longimicrobiaceae bacterium]